MITQEQLQELLHYCPETGVFTWLANMSSRARKGSKAGSIRYASSGKSYRMIKVHGREYLEHRLAFLYMLGDLPEHEVDHIDGNGLNNLWSNLRTVTVHENRKNKRKPANNTSGVMGVCWRKRSRKWQAQIQHAGHTKHLGHFYNKEDAIAARKAAEVLYGFHENHGTERPL